MQKIISLFQRNYDTDHRVRNEIIPGAEWVIAGEGIATRKWDGTCCKIEDGILYKRYEAKAGKTPPVGFQPAQDAPDPISGHWPGWIECVPLNKEDKWHWEAIGNYLDDHGGTYPTDGTYELCGPSINKNPEGFQYMVLIRHGDYIIENVLREFEQLEKYLCVANIEGIVWHHPDGRMVKIKAKDFGIKRK